MLRPLLRRRRRRSRKRRRKMRTWASGCSTKTFLSKKKCRAMAVGQSKIVPTAGHCSTGERVSRFLLRVTRDVVGVWRFRSLWLPYGGSHLAPADVGLCFWLSHFFRCAYPGPLTCALPGPVVCSAHDWNGGGVSHHGMSSSLLLVRPWRISRDRRFGAQRLIVGPASSPPGVFLVLPLVTV